MAHWDDSASDVPHEQVEALPDQARPAPAHPTDAVGGPPDPLPGDDPVETGWRSYEPAPEDDHWEPPAPAPLPPPQDGTFWATLVGLVGGPVLLFAVAILRPDYGTWWALLAVAVTVTGFALLVRRGGVHRDDDDFGIRL